jgi:hypothetical protein
MWVVGTMFLVLNICNLSFFFLRGIKLICQKVLRILFLVGLRACFEIFLSRKQISKWFCVRAACLHGFVEASGCKL